MHSSNGDIKIVIVKAIRREKNEMIRKTRKKMKSTLSGIIRFGRYSSVFKKKKKKCKKIVMNE